MLARAPLYGAHQHVLRLDPLRIRFQGSLAHKAIKQGVAAGSRGCLGGPLMARGAALVSMLQPRGGHQALRGARGVFCLPGTLQGAPCFCLAQLCFQGHCARLLLVSAHCTAKAAFASPLRQRSLLAWLVGKQPSKRTTMHSSRHTEGAGKRGAKAVSKHNDAFGFRHTYGRWVQRTALLI